MSEKRIEINKKAIGKTVKVIEKNPELDWHGEIVDLKNEVTFLIKKPLFEPLFEVSIFDIRYL